jgi:Predicted symporter
MKQRISSQWLAGAAALVATAPVLAAGGDVGNAAKQATNWTAIIMFTAFVVATLWITKWAAGRTKSASDFYRRRRHHRLSERSGDCGRLYVRRLLPGHLGLRHGQRL